MLQILPYVGDAMWILVMALIASTSRGALRRIPAAVRVPLPVGRGARGVAFGLAIGVPLVVGLGLLWLGRTADSAQDGLMVFLIRALTAPLFALAHLLWLRAALRTLDAEGALRP